jgi:hypothetical protein
MRVKIGQKPRPTLIKPYVDGLFPSYWEPGVYVDRWVTREERRLPQKITG